MKKSLKTGQLRTLIACTVAVSLALFLATVQDLSAKPFRMGKIPDKGAAFGCGTCHVSPRGGGARNPFGMDYQKIGMSAGDEYSSELGAMDSDGDGHSNDQEFEAGTHPGKPESKPAK